MFSSCQSSDLIILICSDAFLFVISDLHLKGPGAGYLVLEGAEMALLYIPAGEF